MPSTHMDNSVIRLKCNENNDVWGICILLISLTVPKGPDTKYH